MDSTGTADLLPGFVAESLVGRRAELELIRSFLESVAADGAALLLSGDPGVGKSALLDAAAEAATMDGCLVLRAAGVEFEADVSFAGLNQVLLPLIPDFERLSALHREALSVALGFGEGAPPERLVVATATLVLLREVSAARPVVMIVDDLPWLDRSSAAVLGFVARRLAGSRVGFLGAARSEAESFFERGGLEEYEVLPLDDEAAIALVHTRVPTLAPWARQRLVAEAEGNPLALLELPTASSGSPRAATHAMPRALPLSRRLQGLFASKIDELPAPTRQLLLLAALDGTGELGVLQTADSADGLVALAPAESARLLQVDSSRRRLVFRHPLIRAAVVELSTDVERRRAHETLAQLLVDQPERRAWHLADARSEPDAEVAGLLEQAAHRVLERGDAIGAVAALARAADLSPGAARGLRLAEAAYIGSHVNAELTDAAELLQDARRASPQLDGSMYAAAAAAYLLLMGEGDVDTAHRLLVGAIEANAGRHDTDDEELTVALNTLYIVCHMGGRVERWGPYDAAVARRGPDHATDIYRVGKINADPARATTRDLDRLDAAIAVIREETDPVQITTVSAGGMYLDRLSACRDALWRVVQDDKENESLGPTITALHLLCTDDLITGNWDEIEPLALKGISLCKEHGHGLMLTALRHHLAALAAMRGDDDSVRSLVDEMVGWGAPRGMNIVFTVAHHTHLLAALGRGDFEDAYQHAVAISPPGIFAAHVPMAILVFMDLVEAAVRTNRYAEASVHVEATRAANLAAISPRKALLAAGATALAAPDDRAPDLFEEALTVPGADRWPFDLARVQLAYGERLRRARSITRSRTHLSAALEAFQRLGARPWALRAGTELRASGLTPTRVDGPGPVSLTPQEREIAEFAAAGLTNKQIAERLFMSHRTVGAHLYRVFPKLGVTSRAALRDALVSRPTEPLDEFRS